MDRKQRTREVALLAAAQHGVVSLGQLTGLGYSPDEVQSWVTRGVLHRLHRGVFAMGHPGVSSHGLCLAGVLARGPDALLSFRSAGWLWGLLPRLEHPIEVSVSWRGRGRSALHLHHCPALRDEDATSHEGIPVTAVPRTLLDIASATSLRQLGNAVERAERLDLLDLSQVDDLLATVRGHRGRGKLKRALSIYRDPAFSRSGGELRLLQLLAEAGIPRPAVNTFVEGYEIDMYWERERFAVELDGWDTHRTRTAFETDRKRQEDLKLANIEMVRITGRRLAREPDEVAQRLNTLLQRRRREPR
jgi:hypothetical protein